MDRGTEVAKTLTEYINSYLKNTYYLERWIMKKLMPKAQLINLAYFYHDNDGRPNLIRRLKFAWQDHKKYS